MNIFHSNYFFHRGTRKVLIKDWATLCPSSRKNNLVITKPTRDGLLLKIILFLYLSLAFVPTTLYCSEVYLENTYFLFQLVCGISFSTQGIILIYCDLLCWILGILAHERCLFKKIMNKIRLFTWAFCFSSYFKAH